MAGEEIRIPIGIPVETNADEAGDSVASLREQILSSSESIREMSGTLRQLRGDSDQVKSARAALTAKIGAEKDATTGLTLKLLEQGKTYDQAAAKAARAGKATAGAAKETISATKKEGSFADALKKKQEGLSTDRTNGLASSVAKYTDVTGLAVTATLAAVAAVVMLTKAAIDGGIAFGKWILTAANAARSANLLREAWSGTAANAGNLGTQVAALARNVPTSKAALNDLAISLMKLRLPGQATVDAFNAIGQASAALGDEAGNKIKEFLDRGRMLGKFRLDPREMLEGFGNLEFDDIAAALAKSTKVGIADAKKALYEGRVSIGDGAKAVRDAVEKRFGGLNLRKMLDLNVMAEKARETFDALASGIDLEPLLKPLGELGKLFTDETVTGKNLKGLITAIGTDMVGALRAGLPVAKEFFEGLVLLSMKAYLQFLRLRVAVKDALGGRELVKDGQLVTAALKGVEFVAITTGVAVVALTAAAAALAAPFVIAGHAIFDVGEKINGAKKAITDTNWRALAMSIPEGIAAGITDGVGKVEGALKDLSKRAQNAFRSENEIHSPSAKYERDGKQLPAGTARGVEKGTPQLESAVAKMAPGGPGSDGAQGGARAAGVVVNVTINVGSDGGGAGGGARGVTSPSFLRDLTKAVEDALIGAGIPVNA